MDFGSILTTTVQQAFGPLAIVYCLAAIGLNVHFGYTGLLNFGQAGFMAVGGYAMASAVATWGLSLWVGIAIGIVLAAVLALLLGIPTLRLRADYLAIVTIAAAEMIRLTAGSVTLLEWFGGQDGLNSFVGRLPRAEPVLRQRQHRQRHLEPQRLLGDDRRLDPGRALLPHRVGADAQPVGPRAQGDPRGRGRRAQPRQERLRLQDAVAGHRRRHRCLRRVHLRPRQGRGRSRPTTRTDTTFFAYTILLLGGAARVFGPVVGAMIFWGLINFLDAFFRQAAANDVIPQAIMDQNQAGLIRFIVLGLALMLLMIFRPQGIFGDRRELAIDGR